MIVMSPLRRSELSLRRPRVRCWQSSLLQREAGPAPRWGGPACLDRRHRWLWIPPGARGGQGRGVCAPRWQLLWHAEEPHCPQALTALRELFSAGRRHLNLCKVVKGHWKFDFFFPSDFLLSLCLPWGTSAVEKRLWSHSWRPLFFLLTLKHTYVGILCKDLFLERRLTAKEYLQWAELSLHFHPVNGETEVAKYFFFFFVSVLFWYFSTVQDNIYFFYFFFLTKFWLLGCLH